MTIFVPGIAAPQGSMKHVGRGRIVSASKRLGPWRRLVAKTVTSLHRGGAYEREQPVFVGLEFVMPRPASTPKRRTPPAIRRPDVDKLARAVLDAIDNLITTDDAQVTTLHVHKRLAATGEQPGVHITHHPDTRAEGAAT